MDNIVEIKFNVAPPSVDRPLSLAVELDGSVIWQRDAVVEADTVTVPVPDVDDTQHVLRLIVGNKKPEYTRIDQDGNIISDSLLKITNLTMDELDMSDHLYHFATYTHDCNGTAEQRTETMYSDLGCNGVAEIKFSTPIYLWLLEQM
jgi:hypothetical protein